MSDGSLDLDVFGGLIKRPDAAVRRAAESLRAARTPASGALGRLDDLGVWLAGVQGRSPAAVIERPRLVVFAGDHGVARAGVSARPVGGAHLLVRALLDGESPGAILARRSGVSVRVVDMALDCDPLGLPPEVTRHRVRRGSGRLDTEDALTREEAERAFRTGVTIADEEADSGTDLVVLGDLSVGGTTAAAVLTGALCGTDASVVTGRGGLRIDDTTWMRKCAAIRDGLRRARPVLGDQVRLLAAVGGADLAAMTGFLLQAAVRRTPVLLDGVVTTACALLAQRIAFRAPDWWLAGHAGGEPGQAKALDRMNLEPVTDLGVTTGEGVGALLALPVVLSAAALAAEAPPPPGAGGSAPAEEAGEAGETGGVPGADGHDPAGDAPGATGDPSVAGADVGSGAAAPRPTSDPA
ncbi:nicotinate-nucleotide--dimethylbenzimidazole phosphoribosyltransferase [Streptomyces calidiresistens]|uniref:Nicotinate-nucleotide--dimethylbenzimidazole phosphoribosyltransferase n=1 Tax=Streptomyces calidiresistens TaxID=1485586 RepID=A0A7W3T5R4_9ACTN|nr:nicotinate-nucleotide--dimethylbenzimidazole phosphoribosyltransferase [Streptomyces calidiresistens]MBB0231422.1 nicotinate-nucleotide--dimethylbenzimidazole phosphoribosyltransferase [Streptomyces calidiresistens]